MRLFVAIPFAKEFERVFSTVKDVARSVGLDLVLADRQRDPGPIVSTLYKEIGSADFVVADISTRSANVFYEVGLAHCGRKPTLLLAERRSADKLPFDVRRNRVVLYEKDDPGALRDALDRHLSYFVSDLGSLTMPSEYQAFFSVLADYKESPDAIIERYVAEVGRALHLSHASLVACTYVSPAEGCSLRVQDRIGRVVTFGVDCNGMIREHNHI